jgi:hypothetical protein
MPQLRSPFGGAYIRSRYHDGAQRDPHLQCPEFVPRSRPYRPRYFEDEFEKEV